MYFLLILFFTSLLGITFMIGRKLLMLQNGEIVNVETNLFEIPYIQNAKHLTIKNIKKAGYAGLVAIIRLYFRSSNIIRSKYQAIKIKIKEVRRKNQDGTKEISKFLKVISEYKSKIREIKHKIKEEEENTI